MARVSKVLARPVFVDPPSLEVTTDEVLEALQLARIKHARREVLKAGARLSEATEVVLNVFARTEATQTVVPLSAHAEWPMVLGLALDAPDLAVVCRGLVNGQRLQVPHVLPQQFALPEYRQQRVVLDVTVVRATRLTLPSEEAKGFLEALKLGPTLPAVCESLASRARELKHHAWKSQAALDVIVELAQRLELRVSDTRIDEVVAAWFETRERPVLEQLGLGKKDVQNARAAFERSATIRQWARREALSRVGLEALAAAKLLSSESVMAFLCEALALTPIDEGPMTPNAAERLAESAMWLAWLEVREQVLALKNVRFRSAGTG